MRPPAPARGGGAEPEAWVRNLLVEECEELLVFTGPVYAPSIVSNSNSNEGGEGEWIYASKTVGTFPKLIQVPSHFFKVIVARKRVPAAASAASNNEQQQHQQQQQQQPPVFIAAFMVPNLPGISKHASLKEFVVGLADLESLGTCQSDDWTLCLMYSCIHCFLLYDRACIFSLPTPFQTPIDVVVFDDDYFDCLQLGFGFCPKC